MLHATKLILCDMHRHPDNPPPAPFTQRMDIALEGGMRMRYHITNSLRMIITAEASSSVELVEFARDMGAKLKGLAVRVEEGSTLHNPPLFSAHHMSFFRQINKVANPGEQEGVYTLHSHRHQPTASYTYIHPLISSPTNHPCIHLWDLLRWQVRCLNIVHV